MKKIMIVIVLFWGMIACQSNMEDIDMSKIDFSNIEDLYAQPLPVIQKAVQGKWKVYKAFSSGITYDVNYPENVFVEFGEDYYIGDKDGSREKTMFTWEKLVIKNDISLYYDYETYVAMTGKDIIDGNWYFESIKNDTLSMNSYNTPIGYLIVRLK